MKKVWQAIFVLLFGAFSVKASYIDALPADYWVDSVYQRLTLAEQVGQLLDLRVAPTTNNIQQLEAIITKYHIGAITISGGDAEATVELIQNLQRSLLVPLYISSENNQSLSLPFDQLMPVPTPETFNDAGDPELLKSTLEVLADIYTDFGILGHSYNPLLATFSEDGLVINDRTEAEQDLFASIPELYADHQLTVSTDMQFSFLNDFAFSPKGMDSWNNSEWKEKIENIHDK